MQSEVAFQQPSSSISIGWCLMKYKKSDLTNLIWSPIDVGKVPPITNAASANSTQSMAVRGTWVCAIGGAMWA
jgi:hypothetical protein